MDRLNRVAVKSEHTDYELNVYSIGLESTDPGKTVGPCVRSKYVIHYVLGGRGMFNGVTVKRGDGFLICPNQLHKYTSDRTNPLRYGWISFYGYSAEKLLQESGFELKNQIFTCDWIDALDSIFETLSLDRFDTVDVEKYLKGCFYILISFHTKSYEKKVVSTKQESLIKKHVADAVKYVNDNYCHKISVSEIAKRCFISSHYLSNIFKQEMGFSLQKYIIDVRIKRAKCLLSIKNLSIGDIANSVGYADALAFSKIFSKSVGVSPRAYREMILNGK